MIYSFFREMIFESIKKLMKTVKTVQVLILVSLAQDLRDCVNIVKTVETVSNIVCFFSEFPRLKSWVNAISLFSHKLLSRGLITT